MLIILQQPDLSDNQLIALQQQCRLTMVSPAGPPPTTHINSTLGCYDTRVMSKEFFWGGKSNLSC